MTPTDAQLKRFLAGTLPDAEAKRVADWIETEPAAADTLRRLDTAVSLADALRDSTPSPSAHLVVDVPTVPPTPAVLDAPTVAFAPRESLPVGYRFVRELGRGGMGVVFEAEDLTLRRAVAIKLMLPKIAARPDAKARFLREARAMAAVESDHVVPILHVGETPDGSPYLVMPLLAGETLDARLNRGPLTAAELTAVATDTAVGLAAAHAQGLIHRDIKPSNLWLEANPNGTFRRVRVFDFGLARPTDPDTAMTASNAVVGTPQYMSPEQARSDPLGPATDLFSLGSVLYRAATGQPPFPGFTPTAVLTGLAVDEPVPVRELNPSVAPDLAGLIYDLLRKVPGERPTTDDVIRRLAPTTVAPPPRRGARAWVAAAAAAFFAVVALGIVIIVRDKTGKEVARVEVPDVPKDGKLDVVVDGKVIPVPLPPAVVPGGPSPMGKLDPKAIPPEEMPDTVPDGLVAVLGSRQCRQWIARLSAFAALRPDGNQFVYLDEVGQGSQIDVKTGRRTKLAVRMYQTPLLYSDDGTRLVFMTTVDEKYGIQIVDVSGKEPKSTFFLPVDLKGGPGVVPMQRSADGRTVYCSSGGYDAVETILDWTEADKLTVRCTIPHKDGFTASISADGKILAIRNSGGPSLEVWDVAGKEPKKRLELPGEEGKFGNDWNRSFDFLPDGRLVAVHADKKMRVWDVSGEKPTATVVESWKEWPSATGWNVRVAPSGDTLAVFDQGGIQSMTVPKTGAAFGPVKSSQVADLKLDGPNISNLEFSADGKRALTTHIGYFVVWDVTADGFVVRSAPKQSYFGELGISPDGKTLIGGSQHQATRYEFGDAAPKPMKLKEGIPGLWPDLRLGWGGGGYFRPLGPDGSKPFNLPEEYGGGQYDTLSSASLNLGAVPGQPGQFRWRCWDLSTDKPTKVAELKQSAEVPVFLFAGGKHVISRGGYDEAKKVNKYTLWTNDGGTYKPTDTFEMGGEADPGMASSPDGKRVATLRGQVYDVADGKIKLLKTLGGSSAPRIYRPVFSPDGKKLAFPGRVTVWDIESELREYQWPEELSATKVLFAPDGRHLVTANANGTAFVIRLPVGKK